MNTQTKEVPGTQTTLPTEAILVVGLDEANRILNRLYSRYVLHTVYIDDTGDWPVLSFVLVWKERVK